MVWNRKDKPHIKHLVIMDVETPDKENKDCLLSHF